jgi:hypothetical protein
MKKNRLYIILVILTLIFFFTISGECFSSSADSAKEAAEEVGKSVQKVTKEVEEAVTGEKTDEKEAIKTEDEEKTTEVTGSEQSENVENLQDNQEKSIPVTLKGKVIVRSLMEEHQEPLFITIDTATNKVEGETTLNWEEEIEVSGEGGESHHSHKYICRIKLKGNILGTIKKIDENKYFIDATIAGFLFCDYGYNPKSTEYSIEACDVCKERYNGKQHIFDFEGRYWDNTNKASGEVIPKEWYWTATK